jgi:hypothetical protein
VIKIKIIETIKKRKAFFDGWETSKASYTISCAQCRTENVIVFKEILDAAWSWKETTENKEKHAIAGTFGIDLDNKWIGDGMDAVVTKICAGCG